MAGPGSVATALQMQAHVVHGDSAESNYRDSSVGITDGLDGHGNWELIPDGGAQESLFFTAPRTAMGKSRAVSPGWSAY
jgi:hypothetical protein